MAAPVRDRRSLLGDWRFQVLPGPAEKHTPERWTSATTQQPKFAEVKDDAYNQLVDLVIRSPEHGGCGSRRHLLSGSASETKPGRPPLPVRRRRREVTVPEPDINVKRREIRLPRPH